MNIFETKSEVLNAHYVPCNSRLIDYSNITIRRRGNFRTKRTLEHCCPSLCHLASILDAESNDVDRYRVLNVVSNNASVVEGQCVRWTGGHAHENSGTAVLYCHGLVWSLRPAPTNAEVRPTSGHPHTAFFPTAHIQQIHLPSEYSIRLIMYFNKSPGAYLIIYCKIKIFFLILI